MKYMTHEERELCSFQAKIFEASVLESKDSSAVFARRFMRSKLAWRLDSGSLVDGSKSPQALVQEVDDSYKSAGYGSKKYTKNEMHWMGYFYRCMCCITGKTSKAAYHLIGARELRKLYYPYHSLEAEQAVERVLEAKEQSESLQIERGVRILKKLRGIV